MDKWSTINIAMNLFSTVFELYRNIENSDVFKAAIPYDLTKVEDSVLQLDNLENLPDDFYENKYYVMNGRKIMATIDTGFHKNEGLVNFNTLVPTSKLFKRNHLRHLINNIVFPYVYKMTNNTNWRVLRKDDYDLILDDFQFYISARIVDSCIGLSIVELKYSGVK